MEIKEIMKVAWHEIEGRLKEWTPLYPSSPDGQSNKFSLKTPGSSERDCQGKAHALAWGMITGNSTGNSTENSDKNSDKQGPSFARKGFLGINATVAHAERLPEYGFPG